VARRSTGTGRYHTGEIDTTIVSATYQGNGPLVIVCHGAGTTSATYSDTPTNRADLELLADTGCVVVVPDFTGSSGTWGNDTALSRIAEVRTYAAASWDADLTRMAFIGDSAGAMDALNYHWRNPSLVAATVARIPVVAADLLHDRNALLGGLIDTAYTDGAGWDAAKANRDPSATAPAALIEAVADNVRVYYSTDDTIVLPSDITAFVNLTGVRAIPIGAVGHTFNQVHAQAQAAWLWNRFNQ
jgi:pimeloyl-ACP methyl ester carboxylesterase